MQLWARLGKTGNITAQSGPASGPGSFTSSRKEPAADHPAGDYVVDFDIDVSACSWTASPFLPAAAGRPDAPRRRHRTRAGRSQQGQGEVFDIKAVAAADTTEEEAGALTDNVVGVQVLCARGRSRSPARERVRLLIRSAAATAPRGTRRRGPAPACSALVRSSSFSRSCAASSTSLWRHSAAR